MVFGIGSRVYLADVDSALVVAYAVLQFCDEWVNEEVLEASFMSSVLFSNAAQHACVQFDNCCSLWHFFESVPKYSPSSGLQHACGHDDLISVCAFWSDIRREYGHEFKIEVVGFFPEKTERAVHDVETIHTHNKAASFVCCDVWIESASSIMCGQVSPPTCFEVSENHDIHNEPPTFKLSCEWVHELNARPLRVRFRINQ